MSNKLVNLKSFGVVEMSEVERVHVIAGKCPRWLHDLLDDWVSSAFW